MDFYYIKKLNYSKNFILLIFLDIKTNIGLIFVYTKIKILLILLKKYVNISEKERRIFFEKRKNIPVPYGLRRKFEFLFRISKGADCNRNSYCSDNLISNRNR